MSSELNPALRRASKFKTEYPAPFFDIAQTFMPPQLKAIFKWCKYYYYMEPIVNSTIFKLAEYPVTPIIYETEDQKKKDLYRTIFDEHLEINSFNLIAGLDYFTYGNQFTSIYYPFKRSLKCKSCGFEDHIKNIKYTFRNFEFKARCKDCEQDTNFEINDLYLKRYQDINLIRWDPELIDIEYNPITGNSTYYYNIPNNIKNAITMGKDIIETTPKEFILAVKENKRLVMEKSNFFHLKRPTLSDGDMGWGKPIIMHVLKYCYYLQILRKAQESIALERINPLTFLFPQQTGSLDPYQSLNLGKWKNEVELQIRKWRQDPNHKPIMPIAIGHGNIGGDAKALLVTPEIQAVTQIIAGGMGVPIEFIFGGLNWTGSSVSLRILENHFLTYRCDLNNLNKFIIRNITSFLGIGYVSHRMSDFKMADDVTMKEIVAQQNAAGKISDETMINELGFDPSKEREMMLKEAVSKTEVLKKQQEEQVKVEAYVTALREKLTTEQRANMQRELREKGFILDPASGQMIDSATQQDIAAANEQQMVMQQQANADQANAQAQAEADARQPKLPNQDKPKDVPQTLGNAPGGADLDAVAAGYMKKINKLDPQERQKFIAEIKKQNPVVAQKIESNLMSIQTPQLPLQKAPTRKDGKLI